MTKTISRDELKEKMDRGDSFMLLETLPPTAYAHAHLPGALNMPSDQVKELAAKLLPDKQADIVVYCASPTWHASENAARELATLGYANVRDYAEGKSDWIGAGLATESEHNHWVVIARMLSQEGRPCPRCKPVQSVKNAGLLRY
jgi:rhodanese-related sulfurtransferase